MLFPVPCQRSTLCLEKPLSILYWLSLATNNRGVPADKATYARGAAQVLYMRWVSGTISSSGKIIFTKKAYSSTFDNKTTQHTTLLWGAMHCESILVLAGGRSEV